MTLLKRLSVDRCAFYLDRGTLLQLNGKNWADRAGGKKDSPFKVPGENVWELKLLRRGFYHLKKNNNNNNNEVASPAASKKLLRF